MLSREERKALRSEARNIWREFNGYDGVVPNDAQREAIIQRYQEINTILQQERTNLESEVQAIQYELAQLVGSEPEHEARRMELIQRHEELDAVLHKRAKRFDTDTLESVADEVAESPTIIGDALPADDVPAIAAFPPADEAESSSGFPPISDFPPLSEEAEEELPPVTDFPPLDGTESDLPPISDFPPLDAADASALPPMNAVEMEDDDTAPATTDELAVPDMPEPVAIVDEIDSNSDADATTAEEEVVSGIGGMSLADLLDDDNDSNGAVADMPAEEEDAFVFPALNEEVEEEPAPVQQETQMMDATASPENIQPIIAEDNDDEEDLGSLPPLSDFVSDFSVQSPNQLPQSDFKDDPLLNITSLGDEEKKTPNQDNPPLFGPPPVD